MEDQSSIYIHTTDIPTKASIKLDGSKSISNRLLIMMAYAGMESPHTGLSTCDDTIILQEALSTQGATNVHVGHAGTAYRFLTAYYAFLSGTQVLDGSTQMYKRPIGILVDALRTIGAQISYLGKEGFPPLVIHEPLPQKADEITVAGDMSSQYISSLLMLAPTLPRGLKISIEGDLVSRSYVDMTIALQKEFGVLVDVVEEPLSFQIAPQQYQVKSIEVEADWSAASYYYSMLSLSSSIEEIRLQGLRSNRWQGDAKIIEIGAFFGIETLFVEGGILLKKSPDHHQKELFEFDFTNCPDIAQTVMVWAAAKGVKAVMRGLDTLKIKETNRIHAMRTELEKIGIHLIEVPKKMSKKQNSTLYYLEGTIQWPMEVPCFQTYEDHRMAMSFAPLALLQPIKIEHPQVVSKSYPDFWKDLMALGFELKPVDD